MKDLDGFCDNPLQKETVQSGSYLRELFYNFEKDAEV